MFKGCCANCGVKFNLDTRGGKLSSNFTAQKVIMDCAILLTTARLIVATAILLHIRFFSKE